MLVQADDPISFMQLTAKNETTSKEDQFQLSLLAAMGTTLKKEANDPMASKLNKVRLQGPCRHTPFCYRITKLCACESHGHVPFWIVDVCDVPQVASRWHCVSNVTVSHSNREISVF